MSEKLTSLKNSVEQMKKRLSQAENARSQAQGSIDTLTKSLRERFGVSTPEEASAKYAELELQVADLTTKIEDLHQKAAEVITAAATALQQNQAV